MWDDIVLIVGRGFVLAEKSDLFIGFINYYPYFYGLYPYKKYVYGKDTFCIHFMYVSIDSVYKFRIFNKQFIFEHFLKKLMYTEKINHAECIRNF
ncbi:hypothetical protein GLOIN_2v1703178 [Rhizophagus irregularis DAOM 181602=DAOM 197198]|nr:hypothetical protein GLOIN_2v1703178 [Rhizophagus irregularis DAOM 181602=DAOM 197198]